MQSYSFRPSFKIFQSTLPVRGATSTTVPKGKGEAQISIHAPREGSDAHGPISAPAETISIHAPREGSDSYPC